MQLGMIGLGRMGANLVRRLERDGHECVVYDVNAAAVESLRGEGIAGAETLAGLVEQLTAPRAVWVMVPSAFVGGVVDELSPLLQPGDAIIDGGNSYYRDDVDRAEALAPRAIDYIDVGTSGGIYGLERGFCLMIGGRDEAVARLEPVFRALAPGEHAKDAETAPMRDPHYYSYEFDIPAIAEVWRRGSVVASWLLDLTAEALAKSPTLAEFSGRVSDSGEGRWTVLSAVEEAVPAPVLTAALYERFSSRGESGFADQVLSAMRKEFGGHVEKPAGG